MTLVWSGGTRNEHKESVLTGPQFGEIAKQFLKERANIRFQASGFSMIPIIRDKDILELAPVEAPSCSCGDIVAFLRPSTRNMVIHRIIGKKGQDYLIKGDNVPGTDGCFSAEDILGRVTKIVRDGKERSFGLGGEKYLIAFLSRIGILFYVLRFLTMVKRWFIRLTIPLLCVIIGIKISQV